MARLIAQEFGFLYVDTGAMYRAFAWQALRRGVDPANRPAIKALIDQTAFVPFVGPQGYILRIDGKEPGEQLRTPEVNTAVSQVAAHPELREFLVNHQRALRLEHQLVMEGRDIGTVVFTDTPHKYFIDADPQVRQQRRSREGQQDTTARRDAQDRSRAAAPLIQAADARVIDSTHRSAREIATDIITEIRAHGLSTTSL